MLREVGSQFCVTCLFWTHNAICHHYRNWSNTATNAVRWYQNGKRMKNLSKYPELKGVLEQTWGLFCYLLLNTGKNGPVYVQHRRYMTTESIPQWITEERSSVLCINFMDSVYLITMSFVCRLHVCVCVYIYTRTHTQHVGVRVRMRSCWIFSLSFHRSDQITIIILDCIWHRVTDYVTMPSRGMLG